VTAPSSLPSPPPLSQTHTFLFRTLIRQVFPSRDVGARLATQQAQSHLPALSSANFTVMMHPLVPSSPCPSPRPSDFLNTLARQNRGGGQQHHQNMGSALNSFTNALGAALPGPGGGVPFPPSGGAGGDFFPGGGGGGGGGPVVMGGALPPNLAFDQQLFERAAAAQMGSDPLTRTMGRGERRN
jgi:hypothetical protein